MNIFYVFVIYLSYDSMTWECGKMWICKVEYESKGRFFDWAITPFSIDLYRFDRTINPFCLNHKVQISLFDFVWCLILKMHFVRQKCKFILRIQNRMSLRIERQILQTYFLVFLRSRNSRNREQFYSFNFISFHIAYKILFPFVWLLRSKWLIL